MKNLTASLFLILFCCTVYSQTDKHLLIELDNAIQGSDKYDARKLVSIDSIKQLLFANQNEDLRIRYATYLQLYDAYKVFNYDSAFVYSKKLQLNAAALDDRSRIIEAKIKLGFIQLSSGMFKETFDSLVRININSTPDSIRAEYYALMGRCYYDLGDFDNDRYYTPAYVQMGNRYIDSALSIYSVSSFEYSYFKGLRDIKSGKKEDAFLSFKKIIDRPGLTAHQYAVTASTLSDIYIQNGENDSAIDLLIKASIADIRSSTKETAAIFNLAGLLYKKGDIKKASDYIERAISDAVFYGARQRKVQVSAILPVIEVEKINRVENEKKILITYAVITTLLLLLVVSLAIVIFRQVNKLKIAKKIITDASEKEHAINNKLIEANKIKEEYIGYFFNSNSDFFAKIERFKKSVDQKISDRKLDEIKFLVNNINLKQEKEELLKNFDRVFLKLFPDFVTVFNSMFKEEDQLRLKDNELLNTDLRIFALIRMGIHDNERIAQILEYSVNTIYTYKTKIKNKSLVPNEEFEQRIMDIKTM
ncbi:MAG TPA: DUF6377 domain-containing protein [Puia sp.]|jgi:tetratricopeptide (TPR) repeat protein|nr:DUF6377 domain-containing protein [Puia sp.]